MQETKESFEISEYASHIPIERNAAVCIGCNSCVEACMHDVHVPNPEKGKPPVDRDQTAPGRNGHGLLRGEAQGRAGGWIGTASVPGRQSTDGIWSKRPKNSGTSAEIVCYLWHEIRNQ